MALEGKSLDSLSSIDINNLLENQVAESKTLDYKSTLPGRANRDRKEFLFDVSSFANGADGHIVYGVREKAGTPVEIPCLGEIDSDAEKMRLESMIQDGVSPRIPGIAAATVDMGEGKVVLIVRIPRSWAAPHMVTFQGLSRFYSRNSARKHQMDVGEIRSAFLLSASWKTEIRDFRLQRLSAITSRQVPVPIPDSAAIVLHLVPLGSFASEPPSVIDTSGLDADHLRHLLLWGTARSHWPNFDGVVTAPREEGGTGYAQVYRNGCVEVVDTSILKEAVLDPTTAPVKNISPKLFEQRVTGCVEHTFALYRAAEIEPPIFVMLSLLGVSGYRVIIRRNHWPDDEGRAIDRGDLIVPKVMIESNSAPISEALQPVFDHVWNAAGHWHSPNRDNDGNWTAG